VIVPISKDRRSHLYHVANHAFRRILAAIHLRLHLLDDGAPAPLRWFHSAGLHPKFNLPLQSNSPGAASAFALHPIPLEAKSSRR
jgi:hypothetical protein